MEDPPEIILSQPQKRALEDDEVPPLSTPTKPPLSEALSTPLTVLSNTPSPSPYHNIIQAAAPGSSNNSVAGDVPTQRQSTPASGSGKQPAKRRKLTPKEREEQIMEKEAREKVKAELKAKKEEEKRLEEEERQRKKEEREEEKRLQDEEKRKKREEREEKKRAKEIELQQKEEEKRKKERSQMRLGAFFNMKRRTGGEASGNTVVEATQPASTDTISLELKATPTNANSAPVSPQKAIMKNAKSDYEQVFFPFELPSHAILAPYNLFAEDPVAVAATTTRLEKFISGEKVDMEPIQFSSRGPRGLQTLSITEIVDKINSSSGDVIDLTGETNIHSRQPLDLLKHIPMKYLHFPEDIRPPYYGTYTKQYTTREAAKLARNPFRRNLHQVDYDYDSEAEWEEPEEGEDLDSEGDEDLDEEGEDDMDGFLDDEEDPQVKRRLINGDLEPISTGLCWEDSRGVSHLNDGSGAISTEFREFKMGFLLEPQPRSIDPFSTAYWVPNPSPVATSTLSVPSKEIASNGLMNPPRLPLTQRPVNGMLNTLNSSDKTHPTSASKPAKPPKRLIPADQLPAFKAEVSGSDLTKIALIEALKKKFPKLPKDAISNTLSSVASRVGAKEVDKRWVLLN
ncbi:uncharacterized protein BDR25DRAFT_291320 [Lindgomyces ingoldianus]|uniref:Uncharacterized protein n=1 Tax=Lindgomyces ingoldianus TaxID=673940 RepID=A0ACB6QP43_9PLEO|nr:uncharacterized protein BDR25DRAFT_291320 [Lindgomyces ingoldianus]KAF2467885.1 hypothetical protein BDR25DRAFT_291320 [Lindgomyces ingoldianus]